MTARHIVSINKAAAYFGYSWKTLARLIEHEGAPVVARGRQGKETQIDTVALVAWLLEREAKGGIGGCDEYQRAKLGKVRGEQTALRLDNEARLAQLVPAKDAAELCAATMDILDATFKPAVARIARKDGDLRGRVAGEFDRLLGAARVSLSKYQVVEAGSGHAGQQRSD